MNLAANGADPSGDLLFVNFNQDKTYVYHEVFFDMYVCIWLNCMRLRSPFSQLKRQCKSMSRQHLGVTTQFLSQGMGWFRRRFIHLPSESPWVGIAITCVAIEVHDHYTTAPVFLLPLAPHFYYHQWLTTVLWWRKVLLSTAREWVFGDLGMTKNNKGSIAICKLENRNRI